MTALDIVSGLLGLRPATPSDHRRGDATLLGVVAGRRGPRFLVPTSFPDAAPEACLAYLGLRAPRTAVARGSVGVALRVGLGRFVVSDTLVADDEPGSLLVALADVLHDDDEEPGLAIGVGLGTVDEVWKPTLQVFRPDGTPAAFVKVGLGPVADRLVATEAATLRTWGAAADPRLVVPDLIDEIEWEGTRIAVVAPLPEDVRRLPPSAPSAWPVRELDGPIQVGPRNRATWWTSRRAAWADDARVDALLDRVDAGPDGDVPWGRSHGDWVLWNLARCHRGLAAWDWEYSEAGAPVGLDEVHGAYQQTHVAGGRSVLEALAAARAVAPRVATDARWLADAHIAMLVTRSAELAQLSGRPPADQPELFAAADAMIGTAP